MTATAHLTREHNGCAWFAVTMPADTPDLKAYALTSAAARQHLGGDVMFIASGITFGPNQDNTYSACYLRRPQR